MSIVPKEGRRLTASDARRHDCRASLGTKVGSRSMERTLVMTHRDNLYEMCHGGDNVEGGAFTIALQSLCLLLFHLVLPLTIIPMKLSLEQKYDHIFRVAAIQHFYLIRS